MMYPKQLSLFPSDNTLITYPFPSTRYQGSKRKLVSWIWEQLKHLQFTSVLDVFGGTGVVSHFLKNKGKQAIYNDYLAFNHQIGVALIENTQHTLPNDLLEQLLNFDTNINYPTFITDNFDNIYYTETENIWLDRMVYQINHMMANPYQRAIAWFALFQACIAKRPYNLFHRANLYMRTADIKRSFGNKSTWDTPFELHFQKFIDEANQAIFDNGQKNQALQCDALETPQGFDLVYIDPPYLNIKGVGVDYRNFYHFLEGIMCYETWEQQIDYKSRHHRLKPENSIWTDKSQIISAFEALVARHQESILVLSYRNDGIPSQQQIIELLKSYKKIVHVIEQPIQYVLSNKKSHELLFIATN